MKKQRILYAGLALMAAVSLASCNNANTPSETQPTQSEQAPIKEFKTIYCSPTEGDINSAGTEEDPLPFHYAVKRATPGDTIILKNGVYRYPTRVRVGLAGDTDTIATINGSPEYPITVRPENENENVVFDFSQMDFDGNNRGIQVYGNYWHFKNIDICGAGDNGMYISGSHNTVENCNFYNNRDTGLQIGRGFNNQLTIEDWPSYNLIKNCTSFANYDEPTLGENADGFAAKLTVGYGNVFDGCIAFRNSDDGWDLFAKTDSGCIGTVILYNCVSFENGFLPYKVDRKGMDEDGNEYTYKSYNTMNGDGIGFKLGGSVMEGDVLMENCLSFNNKLHGVGDNSNPGVLSLKNVTTFNNCIGVDEETGLVSSVRGLADQINKSNNFDLARDIKSYNNYYGLVSYINNQADYKPEGDSTYNTDLFRGSMAYSVLNTSYSKGKEIYTQFTDYCDASAYHSSVTDISFAGGTEYVGMSDASFADLSPVNAVCTGLSDVSTLTKYHKQFRNADYSINMGDKIKIVDEKLLKFANGNPIGANVSKSSYSEYSHYTVPNYAGIQTRDDVLVRSVYSVLETICDDEAVFQNFEVPKRIAGCEISWSSSNENIIKFNPIEKISQSKSVVVEAKVTCPLEDTKVTIKATISNETSSIEKEFVLNVRRRNQSIGKIINTGSNAIRVNVYEKYESPILYVLDSSANTLDAALDPSLYEVTTTYSYAKDRNAKHYAVDQVYTSVPGVYEVTVTAISNIPMDNGKSVSYQYNVYVVNPNCEVDVMGGQTITLTKDGYKITTDLSNIDGYMYSLVSDTELTLTPKQLIENENAQRVEIVTDSISASFTADNNTGNKYYAYYVVVNKNFSNLDNVKVRGFETKVVDVTTIDQVYDIATKGVTGEETSSSTTIYSLKNDLDYSDYTWEILAKGLNKSFEGLFNGNGHKISNLTITGTSADKNVNMFYKVTGTVMNLEFENIQIHNRDVDAGKQVGIIGELQGGYVHNIKIKNASVSGREAVAALIGQVSGGTNYVSNCQLINDEKQVIKVVNKYAAGLIGNAQMNSDQSMISLTVNNCAVIGTIGDGNDLGGNIGGILGRVKNDSVNYTTIVKNCYFKGSIISKGQYTAGIVGDFESGSGYAEISYNISLADFTYNGKHLTKEENDSIDQSYAHKNSNPIVGRATSSEIGTYVSYDNLGTWTEYYYASIYSLSINHDLYDDGTYFITTDDVRDRGFDLDNVWKYNESTQTLTLK